VQEAHRGSCSHHTRERDQESVNLKKFSQGGVRWLAELGLTGTRRPREELFTECAVQTTAVLSEREALDVHTVKCSCKKLVQSHLLQRP
jgi:hypothetical protein